MLILRAIVNKIRKKMSQLGLVIIVVKINDVLATRSRVIYLDRRPHRAALILSNLLSTLLRPSLEVVL